MTWPLPNYSKSRVDRAGERLADPLIPVTEELVATEYPIFEDWRLAHSYPLAATHVQVAREATALQLTGEVVHRLKRFPTIIRKLIWEPTRLTQMQDIGGCRVALDSLELVRKLESNLLRTLPHDLHDAD